MLKQSKAVSIKHLATAIALSTLLAACGSEGDSPVPPAPEIAGLWGATSVSIDSQSVSLAAGELYFLAESVEENPILATFYGSEDSNCLISDSGPLTHYGSNQYRDEFGDTGTLSVNDNTMNITLKEDGVSMNIRLSKAIGIAKIDLPVCSEPQDSFGSVIQNDESSVGFEIFIASVKRLFK